MTDTQDINDTEEIQPTQDTRAPQAVQPGSTAGPSADPEDVSPPVAALIAAIRAAITGGASAEARTAGANACRSILTVLEAKPGQPLVATLQPANVPTSPIAALLSQPGFLSKLAAMSREQLLELVKQVTGSVPPSSSTPISAAPRFHLIQLPQVRRPDGK